jgi:Flp pilus assembly protein TadG
MKLAIRKKGERGNTMVEFAIVAPFWIMVFFGTVALGTNLTRTIQVLQTSRDLGHMYAEGTDFSSPSSKNLVTGDGGLSASLVQGMDLSPTGNAVVIFSQVRHIDTTDGDCAGGTCANANKEVFTNRIIIGNSSLRTSVLGNPDGADLNAQGNTKNPTTDTADKTTQFNLFSPTAYVLPKGGAIAFVVEVYMSSPDLSFLGYGGAGNYARAVF